MGAITKSDGHQLIYTAVVSGDIVHQPGLPMAMGQRPGVALLKG